MVLHTNQMVRVERNGLQSRIFKTTILNGVKQGAVLSPTLFALYQDELLKRLKSSGVGCCRVLSGKI